MRRADRLFQIVLLLGRGRIMTARRIASELNVSERTIYRDIADLIATGTPIDGAAGIGYRLRAGHQVPPLMFDPEELAALTLGAEMVRAWTDPALARAADRVLDKVDAVLPERLRGRWDREALIAPSFFVSPHIATYMPDLRRAIDQRQHVQIHYQREDGVCSERQIWPLGLVFWGDRWTLASWCEMRDDFRAFRLDRIQSLERRHTRFPDQAGRRLKDYIAHASNASA